MAEFWHIYRVHSVLEKSLKVLEFSFKNSRPLKCLKTDRSLKMFEKSLNFTNRFWKLHMKNDKFAALVSSLHTVQWWTLLTYRLRQQKINYLLLLVGISCVLYCLPYGTDFCETILFQSTNFGAGKTWWKSLNFGFGIHYEPCIYYLYVLLLLLLLYSFNGLFSRTTWVSRHQKTNLDFLEQELVSVFICVK